MTAKRRAPRTGQPSLFGAAPRAGTPLAERMRPRSVGDVVGQPHLLEGDALLARAIRSDRVPSMILWGPPGCGKTSLALAIAHSTSARFVPYSAVLGGVPELREILAEAERERETGGRTILFVDEIHRFNKAQQDAFLPHVERGTVTLIGATTENPSFSVVGPLLSRCRVFRLERLGDDALVSLLERAAREGFPELRIEEGVLVALARAADGDGRRALGLLETLADVAVGEAGASATPGAAQGAQLALELLRTAAFEKALLHDRAGDSHYQLASAFIKSMRGSDPDAAIYWMIRLVDGGEDPLFVLRRMIIFASEDIGNADPRALEVVVSADAAFRRIGMPEGMYPMAQACLYLASAPKSNACTRAWHAAREVVKDTGSLPVPLELRPAPTPRGVGAETPSTQLMKAMGHGEGYRYAHDEPDGFARGAVYLPADLAGTRFYEPTTRGFEKNIAERLARLRSELPKDPPSER